MGELTLRWQSVPYGVMVVSLLVVAGIAALTRGDRLIRSALLFLVVGALPYTLALTLMGAVNSPEVAHPIIKFGVGSVPLTGPALMMLLLAISGKFEAHRKLFALAVVCSLTMSIIAFTTDLVVGPMWKTAWGLWYNKPGALNDLHVAQFVIWTFAGILLTRRGKRLLTERQRDQVKILAGGLTIVLLSATDSLLVRGIGVFPLSFIPATFGAWTLIIACARYDLLRSRGFDWAAFYEMLVVIGMAGIVVFALFVSPEHIVASPARTALVVVPIMVVALILSLAIRGIVIERWRARESRAANALDLFVEKVGVVQREHELASLYSELLQQRHKLTDVRLYTQDDDGLWRTVVDPDRPPLTVDARVRTWLVTNNEPLITDELLTQRLGGLRAPIESFMALVKAELVVPLVDREQLVGLIATGGRDDERALRDQDRAELIQAASAGARAVTYMHLLGEAAQRMEVVKEVEVATAVQQARSPGEQTTHYAGHELTSFYQPSPQFGGHWWMSHELDDGRILIAIGDVTGHGVSAALISFTVEGACETAYRMFGSDSFDLKSLLLLLNRSVLEVGGGDYAMSCFVALVDPGAGQVAFANAGHPFPYVCRHAAAPTRGNAELKAMVSRGTQLGTAEPVVSVSTLPLEPDDVLVFYSDSIVDSRNPEGAAYGDRRFQRVLREKVRSAGQRACAVIMEDAQSFYGQHPISEDINLVVLRLASG